MATTRVRGDCEQSWAIGIGPCETCRGKVALSDREGRIFAVAHLSEAAVHGLIEDLTALLPRH